jgi:hypothetical protein
MRGPPWTETYWWTYAPRRRRCDRSPTSWWSGRSSPILVRTETCTASRARPGRTLEAPGGTQALARVGTVQVVAGGRRGEIPRPNLLGAILIKASALHLPGGVERHVTDLAFLLSLLTDPMGERSCLSAGEKKKLRRCGLLDRDSLGWRSLSAAQANAGYAALRLLVS